MLTVQSDRVLTGDGLLLLAEVGELTRLTAEQRQLLRQQIREKFKEQNQTAVEGDPFSDKVKREDKSEKVVKTRVKRDSFSDLPTQERQDLRRFIIETGRPAGGFGAPPRTPPAAPPAGGMQRR